MRIAYWDETTDMLKTLMGLIDCIEENSEPRPRAIFAGREAYHHLRAKLFSLVSSFGSVDSLRGIPVREDLRLHPLDVHIC